MGVGVCLISIFCVRCSGCLEVLGLGLVATRGWKMIRVEDFGGTISALGLNCSIRKESSKLQPGRWRLGCQWSGN